MSRNGVLQCTSIANPVSRVFLEDGEVTMDNKLPSNPFEASAGKAPRVMIDTIAGTGASSIVYSITETAKANNLKPYDYFEYLLTEILKHMDDTDRSFLEDLLLWSPKISGQLHKK